MAGLARIAAQVSHIVHYLAADADAVERVLKRNHDAGIQLLENRGYAPGAVEQQPCFVMMDFAQNILRGKYARLCPVPRLASCMPLAVRVCSEAVLACNTCSGESSFRAHAAIAMLNRTLSDAMMSIMERKRVRPGRQVGFQRFFIFIVQDIVAARYHAPQTVVESRIQHAPVARQCPPGETNTEKWLRKNYFQASKNPPAFQAG